MKTLYFEGAGCAPRGEVENCRIRTAFHNDNGESIYLEISGFEIGKYHENAWPLGTNVGMVTDCFYILGDDDENKHSIVSSLHKMFEYTKAQILSLVNSLGCSFERIVVLPHLAGYRVFKAVGAREYNFGDEFEYSEERTTRAEEVQRHFYELEKNEGKKYPNFSLWVDHEDPRLLHLIRHFSGYNKHWTIRTDTANWKESISETALGECGC